MSLPDYRLLFPTEDKFVEALNASGLASLDPKQLTDERHFLIPSATQFIDRIYEVGDDSEFSVVRRWLRAGENGKAINCFASDYAELRGELMEKDRLVFDEMFAPFRLDSEFDLSLLDYGGLATLHCLGFVAVVSPARCAKLSRLGSIYSVTTSFGLLADLSEDLPSALKELITRRADLDDEGWNTLLARYQAVGALWAAAYDFAAKKKRVLVAHAAD